MGYRCPVCGDPQADAVHLANHLAFTALVRGGDHETWLDDHVPDWAESGEDDLADRVTEYAKAAEYPQVFEDTTGDSHAESRDPPVAVDTPDGQLDEEARGVLEEAREMTRQRREAADENRESREEDGS